ncbi:sulfatase-like hydrolase/transferase [Hydrogenophaga sp. BPS33]|uniref:sulfatase-like hydrolase/transferase n=1 Tax=Hydrogenophaga sp. BPS33 TaxID=2651974 RepID=UPI00131F725C|nr:sulfatase-like hydrolase/transferase [Hydrogenophaga sp. BPS33]QHE87620.1 sulfatase-like hydrolase/transferase [Hydrogenophaga sp. BPS33]
MTPQNLLVIMSDEHSRKTLGCYGNPIVHTPHLDALAQRGTRFSDAYTTSPICVPARAAFAVGQYVHQIGFWDNADPYDGSIKSWHHLLRERGHQVTSIGKLHFRSTDEDNGFSEEILPMHVVEGKGDLIGLLRDPLAARGHARKLAATAGPGESTYTTYDRAIAAQAQVWLREKAQQYQEKPWVLFVSFVAPHFPLTAPPEHYYRYADQKLPMPKLHQRPDDQLHPYVRGYASCIDYGAYFEDDAHVHKALASYYGLCTFLDEQIGKVLGALRDAGLEQNTRVVYTSDHGDNLGSRGLWGKSTMYEESAGCPLIIAGEGLPQGKVVTEPVGHIDVFPFIFESTGEDATPLMGERPGISLKAFAEGAKPDRGLLVEYHATGSAAGAFALRKGKMKYVYYINLPAELYDLEADPEELTNVAQDPAYAVQLADCERTLRAICNPEDVERRAKGRQAELIERHGGREAIVQRGDFGNTPAPGEGARFY